MKATKRLEVLELVGSPIAVSTEKAQRVYEAVQQELDAGNKVVLSFKDVEITLSSFLNASIGQLYGKYSGQFLRARFSVVEVAQDIEEMIGRATQNAKRFFKDKDSYRRAYRELASR